VCCEVGASEMDAQRAVTTRKHHSSQRADVYVKSELMKVGQIRWFIDKKFKILVFFFFSHTHHFAREGIDSSTKIVRVTVVISMCGFSLALYGLMDQRWIIVLKIFICVHLKKESHIHLG